MLDKYRHISFDLDGTLVHTVSEYRHGLVPKIVKRLGGRVRDPHDVNRFWFEGDRTTIIQQCFGLDPKIFWDAFHREDDPGVRANFTRAYDDVFETLTELKARGKVVSIITGSPDYVADVEIAKLGDVNIDLIHSTTSGVFPGKPDPAAMHFILRQLKLTPADTLYVGNSDEDVFFAKNAGVDFVHIDRGEHWFEWGNVAVRSIKRLTELLGN